MDFLQVLRHRRMVRSYRDAPVSASQIARITAAGTRAPSAGGTKGQRFVVITDPVIISKLAAAAGEEDYVKRGFAPWLSAAPAIIVVCVDPTAYAERYARPDKERSQVADAVTGEWEVPYWWVDAGASLMAILLAAVDEELAAGFLGGHAVDGSHELLDIPEEVEVVGFVTIGHPAPEPRRQAAEPGAGVSGSVIHHDSWTS